MKRKFWVTTFLTLSGILVLTGCSKEKNEGTVKENKNQEITFMIPDWGVPPQSMLAEFEKEKGIKVNIETVSWDDIRNKIAIAASGNKAAADVFEVDWSWIGEFEDAQWLEPIELSQEDIKDIPSISTFIVNDRVLAVPYANDFRIGYYNKVIYQQAGLDEPQTWNDVMKDMEILKEKNILKYPYTFPLNANEATTTSFIWLTYLRDGKVFNDDGTLNRENALTTLNFINDMLKKGLINPANLTLNGLDTYRQILSKDAAFMVGPTSFIARSVDPDQSKAIGEIEVILPPGKDSKATQTMALTEAVGVSSLSENKEAAKEFVKWYTSKETQKAFFKEISAIPTRTSVLNEVIDAGEIKNSGAMKETSILVKSPFPNGVPAYYAEMSNSIYNAINSMASGNLTPEEAVNQIDSKIQELIKD
ncbi:sugar ABC transporter substrate-binding protein [Fusobacterium mortiferum]|uniref:Sugar ABC transporter substrate-binding protein n=1 Tax=Fusobacterium mortiferum TaxID=850 RepID=A0ABS2G5Z8_FUSMR|nr:sugar ABC transporter substrate-binding protein [Fusobacterium mortiferum]MBM6822747.1 sugar ABC transporter substrate-binding protein [Fusobacterium mortiferum]MBM6876012.1 sugar ABC transporter substrate-binding protein [Fusobacterium mortiferum]